MTAVTRRTATRAAAVSAASLLAACATPPRRITLRKRDLGKVNLDPGEALAAISAYRTAHGLSALRADPALAAMARTQADAMAQGGVLSHDVAGPFGRRLAAAGIDTDHAAENLGAGYFSLDEVIAGWKASPGHNHNLLLPGMTRFGIALAKAPATDYQTYWAMEVADDPRPRVMPPLAGPEPIGSGPAMILR